MKYFLQISFLIILNTDAFCQKMNWEQPIQCGDRGFSIDKDTNNMIFIGGSYMYFYLQNYFDNYELPLVTDYCQHSFIAKTDTNFQIEWIKDLKAFFYPIVRIDNENNILLIGQYFIELKIDSLTILENDRDSHAFIGKFDKNGKLLWHNTIQSTASIDFQIKDFVFDEDNNICIVGNYNSFVIFNTTEGKDTIKSNSGCTGFLANYSEDGEMEWNHSLENSNQLNLNSIQLDNDNNMYVTGWCYGKYYFNSDTLDAYHSDIIIIKYDSSRNVIWSKQIGTKYNDPLEAGYSLALDNKKENFYVTGSFLGTVDFGGKIISANDKNIFLAKYTLDGNLRWIKNSGNWSGVASDVEAGKKVIVDNHDFIYLAGEFRNEAVFGDTSIWAYDNKANSNLYNDVFVAKYYANGDLSWVTHAGFDDDTDYLHFIMKDNFNNIFIGGETRGGAKFGDYLLNTEAVGPGFIARIKDSGVTNRYDNLPSSINTFVESNEIICYPNPFIDKIGISFNSNYTGSIKVELYNTMGRILKTKQYSINSSYLSNIEFNPGNIAPGFYYIVITSEFSKTCQKLIKK